MSKLDDLIKVDDKKTVEPFNLVGRRSLIHSKEDAANILRYNSYYIFVAAAIPLLVAIISLFVEPKKIGITRETLIIYSLFFCVVGVCIRFLKSRIAALLALAYFVYTFITHLLVNNNFSFLYIFILMAASYRAVKASFFYHKVIHAKDIQAD